ncbi:LysR substrate-binding domain-containing protein [Microbacterium sp. KUDC0406]|nr:LysR substrate-binding domain-containing protein [Microbacterium sp. KUDC0406]UJP11585.1 LysR substrate-binding domain-containing protein [Microbacterium sp. KUDC0406]
MDLRDIEIFLTLAEELHFGRTAERLHVSQARVSQVIAQYEQQIGGALFDRSNRRDVRLTSVGAALRDDLAPAYARIVDGLQRARVAARGVEAQLRVGLMPYNVPALHGHWDAFSARHPEYELLVRYASFTDPFGSLRRGEIDVLVTWLPIEEDDLTVGPTLFTDTRVLAVAATHELASRSSVSVEELADYAHIRVPGAPEAWENGYLPFYTPGGKSIERVESVTNADELLQLVSTGEIIHPFPAHVIHYWSLPQIRWLPIPDLPRLTYALVWRTDGGAPQSGPSPGRLRILGLLSTVCAERRSARRLEAVQPARVELQLEREADRTDLLGEADELPDPAADLACAMHQAPLQRRLLVERHVRGRPSVVVLEALAAREGHGLLIVRQRPQHLLARERGPNPLGGPAGRRDRRLPVRGHGQTRGQDVVRLEVIERDGCAAGELVRGRDHQHDRLGERDSGDVKVGLVDRQPEECDVRVAVPERRERIVDADLAEAEVDLREAAPEDGGHRRQILPHRTHHPERDSVRTAERGALRRFDTVEDAPVTGLQVVPQLDAERGQDHLATGALEQRSTDPLLLLRDRLADPWRRDVQLLRRASEMQFLGESQEDLDVTQFHPRHPSDR